MPILSAGANSITINTTSSLTTQLAQQLAVGQAQLLALTMMNRLLNVTANSQDADPLLAQDLLNLATTDRVTTPQVLQ
jgi:hypothetical protein